MTAMKRITVKFEEIFKQATANIQTTLNTLGVKYRDVARHDLVTISKGH